MREIKFRAWGAKERVMVSWQELIDDQYEFNEFNVEGGLLFLQYTGLKDKNGKEIYEGDILYTPFKDKIRVEWLEEFGEWITPFVIESSVRFSFRSFPSKQCEVIGNIYENKELLGKQNET